MVKVTWPANPGGIIPASGPPGPGARGWAGSWGRAGSWGWRVPSVRLPRGRESMPSKMSRYARARSASMPPSTPALRSSLAHAVTRWSAASTCAGGSSRPASPAFPLASAHRSTRVLSASCSRRFFALPGATSITARAIAARSPGGVSSPARPSTIASATRASAGSSTAVAPAMIIALRRLRIPARNAALVPGRLISSSWASDTMSPAAVRVSPSAAASSCAANSSDAPGIPAGPCAAVPGAGRRRSSSATAACLRLLT